MRVCCKTRHIITHIHSINAETPSRKAHPRHQSHTTPSTFLTKTTVDGYRLAIEVSALNRRQKTKFASYQSLRSRLTFHWGLAGCSKCLRQRRLPPLLYFIMQRIKHYNECQTPGEFSGFFGRISLVFRPTFDLGSSYRDSRSVMVVSH